jgi:hypothetical protein
MSELLTEVHWRLGGVRAPHEASRATSILRELDDFTTPAYPLANVLIDPVAASTSLQHGSSSQQRKGHIGLGHPLLAQPACVAQDHPRAGRRTDLQACEEGRHSLAVRTPARRTHNGILTDWQDWRDPPRLSRHCPDQGYVLRHRSQSHALTIYSRHRKQDPPHPQVLRYGCLLRLKRKSTAALPSSICALYKSASVGAKLTGSH